MALAPVLQKLKDLEEQEFETLRLIIKTSDRAFSNTLAILALTTGKPVNLSPSGYITDGDGVVTPVTIVYDGTTAPEGAALVLKLETITV